MRERCVCIWPLRRRQGRDISTPVGADRAAAERALRQLDQKRMETMAEAADSWFAFEVAKPAIRANTLANPLLAGQAGHTGDAALLDGHHREHRRRLPLAGVRLWVQVSWT